MNMCRSILMSFVLLFIAFVPTWALGQGADDEQSHIGVVEKLVGTARVRRGDKIYSLKEKVRLFESDVIQVDKRSVIKIVLRGGETLTGLSETMVNLERQRIEPGKLDSLKTLVRGTLHFFVNPDRSSKRNAKIRTKNGVLGVRGTSGFISFKEGKTDVVLIEGKVDFSSAAQPEFRVEVPAGKASQIQGSSRPTPPQPAPAALTQVWNQQVSQAQVSLDNGSVNVKFADADKESIELKPDNRPKAPEAPGPQRNPNEQRSGGVLKPSREIKASELRPIERIQAPAYSPNPDGSVRQDTGARERELQELRPTQDNKSKKAREEAATDAGQKSSAADTNEVLGAQEEAADNDASDLVESFDELLEKAVDQVDEATSTHEEILEETGATEKKSKPQLEIQIPER